MKKIKNLIAVLAVFSSLSSWAEGQLLVANGRRHVVGDRDRLSVSAASLPATPPLCPCQAQLAGAGFQR